MIEVPFWFANCWGLMWNPQSSTVQFYDGKTINMKPGRYLKKYRPQFSDEEIRDRATRLSAEMTPVPYKLATTEDEAIRVYKQGPHSCMSYNFRGHIHPATFYVGPDLFVAYLERDGRITARAVVWPDRKIWHRCYGDIERLKLALEADGYTHGIFVGARINRVEKGLGFVRPYIDGASYALDKGDHLLLSEWQRDVPMIGVRDQYCGRESWGVRCSYLKRYVPRDETEIVRGPSGRGVRWSRERMAAEGCWRCYYTGRYWREDVTAVTLADGSKAHTEQFRRQGFTCAGNGKNYHRAWQAVHRNGRRYSSEYIRSQEAQLEAAA